MARILISPTDIHAEGVENNFRLRGVTSVACGANYGDQSEGAGKSISGKMGKFLVPMMRADCESSSLVKLQPGEKKKWFIISVADRYRIFGIFTKKRSVRLLVFSLLQDVD